MTTTQTRRRRRSALAAEPHVLPRRASTRFHPISNIFGIVENEPIGLDETSYGSHRNLFSLSVTPIERRPETYSIEGGWTEGLDGRLVYVEHGRIEEIDDLDEDYDNDKENNEDMTTPRALPSLSSPTNSAGRRNTFGIPITDPLPPSTTPPPCPRPNRLPPQLFSSPSVMAPHAGTTTFPSKTQSAIQGSMPSVLDTGSEIALLQENLNLLSTVYRDLQNLCTWFYAQTPVETFSEHIDTCGLIEEDVQSIQDSLNRRRKLGEEEWNVRSAGWHEKYSQRLYSLRRTLVRLLAVRPTVERRKLKPSHITLVLEKLQHHHLKLSDLSKKFAASLERLRLRHIHYLLTQAHEAARQKTEARREDQATFERHWYEDKAIRADLRREFFQAYRTTRQPSAQ
ncbi:hypothetical protein CC2G_008761 [Coprinopsis cinerea AmutBmut pab1-1]|nr:hypothetical protein CC2G_008761 [Coprinopsis cinerea AmutBmut pab1-1]